MSAAISDPFRPPDPADLKKIKEEFLIRKKSAESEGAPKEIVDTLEREAKLFDHFYSDDIGQIRWMKELLGMLIYEARDNDDDLYDAANRVSESLMSMRPPSVVVAGPTPSYGINVREVDAYLRRKARSPAYRIVRRHRRGVLMRKRCGRD